MIYKAYLSHHGVRGQKWGVENGPPYPLNDTVKAIAFRGGRREDGSYIQNFTDKDVRKARKLVDKHLNTMTDEEIREYKARLMMEKDMNSFMNPKSTRLKEQVSDAAIDAVSNSVRSAGTKLLTNVEIGAVGKLVGNVFGDEAAAMITDGITTYQFAEKARNKEKEDREYGLRKAQQEHQVALDKEASAKDKRDFAYKKELNEDTKNKDKREYEFKVRQQDATEKQQQYTNEQSEKDKEYQRLRDSVKDEQTKYTNETNRMKAENERYANETAREKNRFENEQKESKARNEAEGREYADRKAARETYERQANAEREFRERQMNAEREAAEKQREFDRAKEAYNMYKDYMNNKSSNSDQDYEYVKREKNSDGTYTYYYDEDDDIYANSSPNNLIGAKRSNKSKKRR